jgi:N-acetylmuramoyl-L-alanine amidase
MAKRIQSELSGKVKCVLIRSSDCTRDLDDRVKDVNRYDDAILVSVHFNSSASHIAGPEVYYWRVDSYTLGKRILASLSKVAPYQNASRGLVRRRLRLTRNPDHASVLVECGYLSNPRESKLTATAEYRTRGNRSPPASAIEL